MKNSYKTIGKKLSIVLSVLLLSAFTSLNVMPPPVSGYYIDGPGSVEENSTHYYHLYDILTDTFPSEIFYYTWSATNGTINGASQAWDLDTVSVTFGTGTLATIDVNYEDDLFNMYFNSKSITLTVPEPPAPPLSDKNYIHTIAPRIESTDISALANDEKIESVTYFDGLGRPMQSIGIRAGSSSQDIITHIEYDEFGRQVKDYLPYTVSNNYGQFITTALSATNNFYDTPKYENTLNPYSEKLFEDSPLNRILKQAAPGEDWQMGGGHEIEFEYQTNTGTEVKMYGVTLSFANNTYTPTLILNTTVNNGNYNANELYKSIVKDENHDGTSTKNHTVEEFKDKLGRVILKRTYADISSTPTAHDTYYVYDDYGNLTYVLPPKADADDDIPNTTELDELCYQYKYDHRNRLVEKKIPGKGDAATWESIIYDKLDRPILTQDPNLKAQNKWLLTIYDAFGRVLDTGLKSISDSRVNLQGQIENGTFIPSFTYLEILTTNYYDNYNSVTVPTDIYGVVPITNVKGLLLGTLIKVLGGTLSTKIDYFHDQKGRVISTKTTNGHLSTTDIVTYKLDFVGNILESTTVHKKTGDSDIVTVETFIYDHMGRLKTQKNKINSLAEETILHNTYDDLGQLITKGVGGETSNANRLQDVNYTYNIRGWLNGINNTASLDNDLFGFKINYNTVNHSGTTLYNGNISETEWKTSNDNVLRWYSYGYDALNRITDATGGSTNHYNLDLVQYDKNGNITNLKRQGHINSAVTSFGVMDDLTYSYDSGNRLLKIADAAIIDEFGFKDDAVNAIEDITDDYSYDTNGNLLSDANKGITSNITYNHLNLPTLIPFSNGNISYIYDATGVKLQKKVVENGKPDAYTYYAGNYVYEDNSLKFFNHPEGYVEPDGSGGYDYVYQYKDHLGNIRLSYKNVGTSGTPNLQIQEENNYYPFGLKHKGYNGNIVSEHNWKFQGAELNESLGLNLYEMDYRSYDPAIGRFTSIDPVVHHSMSTYTAFDNNPVFWADPSGADAVYNWDNGKYEDENGKNVSWKNVKKEYGIGNDDDNGKITTKFVTEGGETIADTEDGSDDVYVIRDENVEEFVNDLKNNIAKKKDIDSEKNKELGNEYGFNIDDRFEEYGLSAFKNDADFGLGYFCGHNGGLVYCGGAYALMGDGKGGGKPAYGIEIGKRHKRQNIMNVIEPTIFDGSSFDIKVTKAGPSGRKYSDRPIPLLIEQY